jgi:hypothetical protein
MLDQSAGPSGHGRRSLEWVQLDDAEHHVISRLTLEELARLVGSTPDSLLEAYRSRGAADAVTLRPEEIEELAEIGGVARLTSPAGHCIAVARIGRTSLIGFTEATEPGAGIAPVEVRLESAETHDSTSPTR